MLLLRIIISNSKYLVVIIGLWWKSHFPLLKVQIVLGLLSDPFENWKCFLTIEKSDQAKMKITIYFILKLFRILNNVQKGRSNFAEVEQKAMTVRKILDDDFETNETNQWFLYETCKIQGDVYFFDKKVAKIGRYMLYKKRQKHLKNLTEKLNKKSKYLPECFVKMNFQFLVFASSKILGSSSSYLKYT